VKVTLRKPVVDVKTSRVAAQHTLQLAEVAALMQALLQSPEVLRPKPPEQSGRGSVEVDAQVSCASSGDPHCLTISVCGEHEAELHW
jgi:hypothetical protein